MSIISVRGVTKVFSLQQKFTLLSALNAWWSPAQQSAAVTLALDNISFSVSEGESVALVGANGAGKSTLLGVVCGLVPPDYGSVEVKGSIAALLELGTGFHSDLTGRENLRLNAALMGMTPEQAKSSERAIIDFSELGRYIEEPLRTYSSGMVLRLAFSVAVHCRPSIVIVDEVLAVGDSAFAAKCRDRLLVMKKNGCTFLCVSHSTALVREFCTRALWLDRGRIMQDGPVERTLAMYHESCQMRSVERVSGQ